MTGQRTHKGNNKEGKMNELYQAGYRAGRIDTELLGICLTISRLGDGDYNKGYRAGHLAGAIARAEKDYRQGFYS